jgi:XTP/dITP diphosphohydrolase
LTIYCATTNPGKIREFQFFGGSSVAIQPLPGLTDIVPPKETGDSFEANARLKALYYASFCPGWLFAEDSGLEVDALGGRPGVHSARYSGADATDERNNALLLREMAGKTMRSARYVCVIALARAGEIVGTFTGSVAGLIAEAPRGSGGFGYDPLFFYPPFNATFGEVEKERKQSVSHRGEAMRRMLSYIERELPSQPG